MTGAWTRIESTKDRTRIPRAAGARSGDSSRDEAEIQADRAMSEAAGGHVRTTLTPSMPLHTREQDPPKPGSHGRPLDAATRQDMEFRFNRNFGAVRVHADAATQRHADSLGAAAWAYGRDIGFATGRYAPQTGAGRELLAHELAHVVQQTLPGASQRLMCKPQQAGTQGGPQVKAATSEEKREFVKGAIEFLKSQGEFFSGLPQPRDPGVTLPLLRKTFNDALELIKSDASPDAWEITAKLHGTYTDAVRNLLTASTRPARGSKTTPPTLKSLYERHHADIESFAIPVDSGADELITELEATLPANPTRDQRNRHRMLGEARRRMKLSTATVTMNYADLFKPNASNAGTLPAGMTVRFSSTIPSYLRAGLQQVVIRMGSAVLEPNSTLMLALDLRKVGGGHDAYRFTRLDLASGRTPQIEVLVERQSTLLGENLGTTERSALQKRFDGAGFKRDSSYSSQSDFDQALIGVGEAPDSHLSGLSGLTFKREGAHPTSPSTSGEYRINLHEIAVFDRAYNSSISRLGRAGRTLKGAAYTVVHELGHAADWRALRTTATATKTAENAMLAEFGTGPNRWGFGANATEAQRARYRVLDTSIAGVRNAQMAARSRSGARWQRNGNTNEITHSVTRGNRSPAFQAAAARDDGPGNPRMPTNYPGVDPDHLLDEYYAECFAMYQTNPDLLRRIRPNVHAFFQRDLPK